MDVHTLAEGPYFGGCARGREGVYAVAILMYFSPSRLAGETLFLVRHKARNCVHTLGKMRTPSRRAPLLEGMYTTRRPTKRETPRVGAARYR